MIAGSNTTFTGVASIVSLRALRVSMPAFSTATVVKWCSALGGSPTAQGAQGSKAVMVQDGGRWEVGGDIVRQSASGIIWQGLTWPGSDYTPGNPNPEYRG